MKLHNYQEEFKTLISVVANKLHIPESAVESDYYIVLDHGLKVEEGKHSELVKMNGVYANIYRAQTANINLK